MAWSLSSITVGKANRFQTQPKTQLFDKPFPEIFCFFGPGRLLQTRKVSKDLIMQLLENTSTIIILEEYKKL